MGKYYVIASPLFVVLDSISAIDAACIAVDRFGGNYDDDLSLVIYVNEQGFCNQSRKAEFFSTGDIYNIIGK